MSQDVLVCHVTVASGDDIDVEEDLKIWRIVLGRGGSMTRVLPLGFPATGYSWHFNPTATPPLPPPRLTKNTIAQDLGTVVKQNYTCCRSGKPSHCLESKFTPELSRRIL